MSGQVRCVGDGERKGCGRWLVRYDPTDGRIIDQNRRVIAEQVHRPADDADALYGRTLTPVTAIRVRCGTCKIRYAVSVQPTHSA